MRPESKVLVVLVIINEGLSGLGTAGVVVGVRVAGVDAGGVVVGSVDAAGVVEAGVVVAGAAGLAQPTSSISAAATIRMLLK